MTTACNDRKEGKAKNIKTNIMKDRLDLFGEKGRDDKCEQI